MSKSIEMAMSASLGGMAAGVMASAKMKRGNRKLKS
jgi:membrane associated rhomboid family serine protease